MLLTEARRGCVVPAAAAWWLLQGVGGRGACARAEPLPNGGGSRRGGLNHLDSFLPSKFQFARQEGEAEAKNTACVFQGMLWLPALVS